MDPLWDYDELDDRAGHLIVQDQKTILFWEHIA